MPALARGIAVSLLLAAGMHTHLAAQDATQSTGGQQPLGSIPAASLSTVPPLASMSGSLSITEVTIGLSVRSAVSPSAAGALLAEASLQVVARRPTESPLVRERDPQLAADELVVIAVDSNGTAIGWQHLKDPRLLRAEAPGPDGVLAGQTLYRSYAEFAVAMPEDARAVEMRVYETDWTGHAWTLVPLGTVSLRPR
jgi:hypothetical protein